MNHCPRQPFDPYRRGVSVATRWGIVLAVAACLIGPLARCATAQGAMGADSIQRATPTPDELTRWVQQLDDNNYRVRRDATEQLIRSGSPAAVFVARALAEASVEQLVRGLHVLHQLALSGDAQAEREALRALRQLADDPSDLVRNRAKTELDSLVDVFQERAITKLGKLGAVIQQYSKAFGALLVEAPREFSIKIDDTWRGTAADLEHFRWLRDAQSVWLSGDKITDSWIPHLSEMKNIQHLRLHRTPISDQGLHQLLSSLPLLMRLDVWYCDITDGAFPDLAGRVMWDKVRLYGTPTITKAGLQRMKGFANEVDFRPGGGLLGISPITPDARQIGVVQPLSGADKAGLRAQDIVRTFDAVSVQDFYHITRLIGKKSPGETIRLGILRGGRKMVLPVVLGAWPFDSR